MAHAFNLKPTIFHTTSSSVVHCVVCYKEITDLSSDRVDEADVPFDRQGDRSCKKHKDCKIPENCAWCGKCSFKFGNPKEAKPDYWKTIPADK